MTPINDANVLSITDLWVVFDHMKPAIGHDEHKRPPSCILAGFNGTFNFEIGGANITTKIPLHAQARNHTCGLETQELHLRWNPHSRIKFYFEQDVNVRVTSVAISDLVTNFWIHFAEHRSKQHFDGRGGKVHQQCFRPPVLRRGLRSQFDPIPGSQVVRIRLPQASYCKTHGKGHRNARYKITS